MVDRSLRMVGFNFEQSPEDYASIRLVGTLENGGSQAGLMRRFDIPDLWTTKTNPDGNEYIMFNLTKTRI
jgi:hypothetical protein